MSTDVSEEHVASLFKVEEFSSGLLFGLFFDPQNGGDMFLRNVG
jgi:hypothetical protein